MANTREIWHIFDFRDVKIAHVTEEMDTQKQKLHDWSKRGGPEGMLESEKNRVNQTTNVDIANSIYDESESIKKLIRKLGIRDFRKALFSQTRELDLHSARNSTNALLTSDQRTDFNDLIKDLLDWPEAMLTELALWPNVSRANLLPPALPAWVKQMYKDRESVILESINKIFDDNGIPE